MATKKAAARASPPAKRTAAKAEATEAPRERRLTPKQEAFVGAYLANGCNASAAYREAYGAENMNQPTIAREASRLLQHPLVAPMVAEHREKLAKQHGVTAEMVIRELRRLATSDIRKTVVWSGEETREETKGGKVVIRSVNDVLLKASDEIDDDTAAAIAEISQGAHGVRIRFHDKAAALDKLARHLGLFEEPPERETMIIIRDVRSEKGGGE